MLNFDLQPIIAAVHTEKDFHAALQSKAEVIFALKANILSVADYVKKAHKQNKKFLVHTDMSEGIAKDEFGIAFIARAGANGIISTKGGLIKAAKKHGLITVQRFFVIDSRSVKTALDAINANKPDLIEIMPGIIPKVIAQFKEECSVPIITGGLIETKGEIIEALKEGASAISTSKHSLWTDV